jgi:hypothetical protein
MTDDDDVPVNVIPLWKDEYRKTYGEDPPDDDLEVHYLIT